MGWDTKVVLIAEGVTDEMCIPALLYELDSRDYMYSSCVRRGDVLIYSYERRKYLPYWVVEDLSKAYPSVRFTLLGDNLEDASAIAGLIRISNGEIGDSYCFSDEWTEFITYSHPEHLYRWFRFGGPEELYRERYGKAVTFLPREDGWGSKVEYDADDEIWALRAAALESPAAYGWEVEVIPLELKNNQFAYDWAVRARLGSIKYWSTRKLDREFLKELNSAADFYFRHGQFAEAEAMYQRALKEMDDRDFHSAMEKEIVDRLLILAERRGEAAQVQTMQERRRVVNESPGKWPDDLRPTKQEVDAHSEDVDALYELGLASYSKLNTWAVYRQSMRSLLQAAEQGDVGAYLAIGARYLDGLGVPQNYTTARSWFLRAIAHGGDYGSYHLGQMYRMGLGVARDVTMAIAWYRKAADAGYRDAEFQLEMLAFEVQPDGEMGPALPS